MGTPAPTPRIHEDVTVEITTDNYPSETSWTLTNTCTDTVEGEGSNYPSAGTTCTEDVCAPDAEYAFTISDSYGDGICCSYGSGKYEVIYKGAIVASGGSFGASETTTFGSCDSNPTDAPTKEPTTLEPTTLEPTTPAPDTPAPDTPAPDTPAPDTPVFSPVEDEMEELENPVTFENGEVGYFKPNAANRITNKGYGDSASSIFVKKTQKVITKRITDLQGISDIKVKVHYMGNAKSALDGPNTVKMQYRAQGVQGGWQDAEGELTPIANEWQQGEFEFSKPTNKNWIMFRFFSQQNNAKSKTFIDNVELYGA